MAPRGRSQLDAQVPVPYLEVGVTGLAVDQAIDRARGQIEVLVLDDIQENPEVRLRDEYEVVVQQYAVGRGDALDQIVPAVRKPRVVRKPEVLDVFAFKQVAGGSVQRVIGDQNSAVRGGRRQDAPQQS